MLLTNRLVAFALLLFSICASAVAANTSDETAIRVAVIAFQEAWNHHDMKAMGDVFTEDANLINVLGTRWQGRAEIVKALGVYHRVMFQNEQIHLDKITIRLLTLNVAVAVAVQTGSGEEIMPDGHKDVPSGSQLDAFVLVKRNGVWKVAQLQNTIVNQEAQRFDPIKTNWNGEIPK